MDILNIIIYTVLAVVVIGSALAMLLVRNAIYSALFLVMNFLAVAVYYFILGAPFIGLVQVSVYAGSIMVLFLFVIMLLGAERLPKTEPLKGQRLVGLILGLVFLVEAVVYVTVKAGMMVPLPTPVANFGDPMDLGLMLFNQYGLLFLVTSIILLAATVGAIVLTRGDKPRSQIALQKKENE